MSTPPRSPSPGTGFCQHTGDHMKTTTLIAILIPVSIFATAAAIAAGFEQDPGFAALFGCGAYLTTLVTGLVMGAK